MATSLMNWDPVRELAGIRQQIDRTFMQPDGRPRSMTRTLPFDLYETENELVLAAALPGVSASDVDISIEQGVLHLRGAFPGAGVDPDAAEPIWHFRALAEGPFAMDLALPVPVIADEAQAAVRDGILTLRLPKAEWAKRRKIQIAVE